MYNLFFPLFTCFIDLLLLIYNYCKIGYIATYDTKREIKLTSFFIYSTMHFLFSSVLNINEVKKGQSYNIDSRTAKIRSFFLPFINSPVNYSLASFGSKLKKDDKNYSGERILCSTIQTLLENYS